MTNAILLRSGVNRKVHAPFWSRVGRGDLPGLGNIIGGDQSMYIAGPDLDHLQVYPVSLETIYGIAKWPVLPGTEGILNLLSSIMQQRIITSEKYTEK
jgi:hypothetical protein